MLRPNKKTSRSMPFIAMSRRKLVLIVWLRNPNSEAVKAVRRLFWAEMSIYVNPGDKVGHRNGHLT